MSVSVCLSVCLVNSEANKEDIKTKKPKRKHKNKKSQINNLNESEQKPNENEKDPVFNSFLEGKSSDDTEYKNRNSTVIAGDSMISRLQGWKMSDK
jgi:hypothetical protein